MITFEELLQRSAALHQHLCPRQVLGVRMGLLGGHLLGLDVPQSGKRLLTIVETDGCLIDGLVVATGCSVGRRSMRVLDFGKVAAVFIDTQTGVTVRVVPSPHGRRRAQDFAPEAQNRWEGYLLGYQRMPDTELFVVETVKLAVSLQQLLSKDGYRVNCQVCGEEIINEREVVREESILCRACAGARYYHPVGEHSDISVDILADLAKM